MLTKTIDVHNVRISLEEVLALIRKKEGSSSIAESEELISEQIKTLVEDGNISEAREVLSTIQPGTSRKLDNWRNVLATPKVTLEQSGTGGSLQEDAGWLQQNSGEYKGRWVALKQGILLGNHTSRLELHRSLKQAGKLAGALFFRIEE